MSYRSKINLISIFVGALLIAAYIIYAVGGFSPALDDLKSWAIAMLVFIVISAVILATIQILLYRVMAARFAREELTHGEKKTDRSFFALALADERDKLVELKSYRVGYILVGIGFVAVLTGLAFGLPNVLVLHILFGVFVVSSIAELVASIYFYEKGVRNG
jgi:hypothetical protein